MKINDPYDGKPSGSVRELIAKYSSMLAFDVLAYVLDSIGGRANVASPRKVIEITGTGANQTIAHGLTDDSGKKVAPMFWSIVGFSALDTAHVVSADDTNLVVYVTDKGKLWLAVY